MTFRILVTSVGGAMSPVTLRALRNSARHRIEVVGVDSRADAIGQYFANRFDVVPPGTDPGYPDQIAALVRRHGIDLVLACSDEEAIALAKARPRFEAEGCRIAAAESAALEIIGDKGATYARLAAAGLPAPAFRLVRSEAELLPAIDAMREQHGTVAVKPTRSRGSRDVFVIEKDRRGAYTPPGHRECYIADAQFRHEHAARLAAAGPLLVMEGLRAPAFDIDVLASSGRLLRAVPRKRVNPAGIPFRGGEIVDSPQLGEIAAAVTTCFGMSWLFDIDLMSDANGGLKVIEVNPRPSGSVAASAAAGIPILDDLVSLAKGEELEDVVLRPGLRILPYTDVVIV